MNNDIRAMYICFLQKMPQSKKKFTVKQTDNGLIIVKIGIDVGVRGIKRLFATLTLKK